MTAMPENLTDKQSAFVSLGSNLGDRAGNLLLAVRGMLNAGLSIKRLSSIYETQPVDVINQPLFLNTVAELSVDNLPSPEQLLARLLHVEYAFGVSIAAASQGVFDVQEPRQQLFG